jgi:hypothetical protein
MQAGADVTALDSPERWKRCPLFEALDDLDQSCKDIVEVVSINRNLLNEVFDSQSQITDEITTAILTSRDGTMRTIGPTQLMPGPWIRGDR